MTTTFRPSAPPGQRWHERLDAQGQVRPAYAGLHGVLSNLHAGELLQARLEADRLLADDGVSYLAAGSRSRAWHLDPIPLVIDELEWAHLETGIQQRAELLNLILTDLYGPQELLRSGALPSEVVFGHPGYLRSMHGVRNPGHRQLVTVATDVVRDGHGAWRVLGDRTQSPSGAAYALANRSVMSRVLTEEQRDAQVLRLAPYLRALRTSLRRLAPPHVDNPRVVVLTSGSEGETSFEHAALAAALGYPLVEGEDLAVRGGHLKLRSLDDLEPVDVVLRRVDADWCDPLELRPESTLGVPGLVEAVRRGNVAIANPFGAGVLENPGLLAHLPELCQQLLGQPLHLAPAASFWCGNPEDRAHVLDNLDQFVVKPISRGHRQVAGWHLGEEGRAELARRIQETPHWWVGQEALAPSLAPTLGPTGEVEDRAAILRTFVVADDDGYVAMAGGLTRVDDPSGLVITNGTGAWSKDTWVVSGRDEPLGTFWYQDGPIIIADTANAALSVRAADNLVWIGRFAERAEVVVRLLRVIDDRRTDFGAGTGLVGGACVDVLLEALTKVTTTWPGFAGDDGAGRRAEPDQELAALVLDADRPGTVAHALQRLLHAGSSVRDRLSGDTWPVANALHREVLADSPGIVDAHGRPTRGGLGRVLTGLLALQGLSSESFERDATWTFAEVGRRIERGLQTLSLLRATVVTSRPSAVDSLVFESVLTASESIITYRRRYRSRAQVSTLLDLLLLDGRNPRSVAWQLDRLTDALRQLPDHPGDGQVSPVEQLVLDTATALRLADTARLAEVDDRQDRTELAAFLDHLLGQLQAAADLLFSTSLAPPTPHRSTLSPTAPTATLASEGGES